MAYIDPRGKSFAHLERLSQWQHGQHAAPVTVEWDLSNVCSLGCQSCHFAHTHVAGPWARLQKPANYSETGRFADVDVVTRGLKEMAIAGVKALVWSGGGEPTLHPRITEIVAQARHWGLQQGLYTLGGHVTDDMAEKFGQALSWAVVSLDCADPVAYSDEKRVPERRWFDACDGVTRLAKHVPTVGVSFLLHSENWHLVSEMRTLGLSLGARYVTFRPTIETHPSDPATVTSDRTWIDVALPLLRAIAAEPNVEIDVDRFEAYRDWAKHPYPVCHGIKLLTMVTPDGRVWVCPNRRGMVGSEIGNLSTESFQAIWARHPGQWTDFAQCRVMCRLHLVNETLSTVFQPREHAAFI
jgi:MoaA/NifB/PqqE/SkfB family radical SAM enzyme